ncbi:MAG TPA: DUF4251 domain-containing protein [Segetibacter sp.]
MNIKAYNKAIVIILLALAGFKTTYGQEVNENKNPKFSQIQDFINSKNYVFVAQTALPIGGRAINLTSPYEVRVSGDTVASDLPYFGRAFVAPMNPSEGGIHFTSTNFNYKVKGRKKGGWDIAILPKDSKDVRQMLLTVSESGYGTLQVVSNNRQQISYNGYVKERKGRV